MVRILLSGATIRLIYLTIKPLAVFPPLHPTMAPSSLATAPSESARSTARSESPPLSIPVSDDDVPSVQASTATEKETDEEELGGYFCCSSCAVVHC